MNWFFFEFTPAYPYLSSAIKFMILGTFGEWLGGVIGSKGNWRPFPFWMLLPKIMIWSLLGIFIKWGFSTFVLLVNSQTKTNLLPEMIVPENQVLFAFTVSTQMNIFFGPTLMYLHRFLDNLLIRRWNFSGMSIAIYSLLWFWLPAHTITFLLPETFRIIFAALLGVCLGVILGFTKKTAR